MVHAKHHAFTLIEILIVVVILSILAAVVIPQFADASSDATAATLSTSIRSIKNRVDFERQNSSTGTYPTTIDPTWFASNLLPTHPENTFGVASIQVFTTSTISHPVNKVLKAGVAGAYWYNSLTGDVRARVADQGSSAKTIDFYNRVNFSNETSLGNYTGGGGSGGGGS